MLFNSTGFLIFFPIVVACYFVVPKRFRYLWLLAASYYFYAGWNPAYLLLIFAVTVVSYAGALFIDAADRNDKKRNKKLCLAICVIWSIGILVFFKYIGFMIGSFVQGAALFGIHIQPPLYDVVLPVGISFYTFQALGYVTDVYRRDIPAVKNFLRYALFISFFPQLVAGPIERSKNLMHQLKEEHSFDIERVKSGLLLMGWGFFQKLVIADRIAVLVDEVYGNYPSYSGLQICMATVLFAFQIYCDFGGYSDIAVGAARVLGFYLTKNFNSPYYAVSVSEFWRRWHISLTTWFRDYIYIPLGGNRRGKWKKYRNIAWLFFRADNITTALRMIWQSLTNIGIVTFFDVNNLIGINTIALPEKDFIVMLAGLLVLMIVDNWKRKKVDIKGTLDRQNIWFRWIVYYGLIFAVVIFGVYGPEYDSSAFIYFQF